jgi:hypothetical protein
VWRTLPESVREEVVALLVELLRQPAATDAPTVGRGDDDE